MSLMLLGILQSQAAGGGASFEHLETFYPGTASSWSINGLDSYSDYTHLHVRATLESSRNEVLKVRFNNDTGSTYDHGGISGPNSGNNDPNTSRDYVNSSSIELPEAMGRSGQVDSVLMFDLMNFNSTTQRKTMKGFFAYASDGYHRVYTGLGRWQSTAAISSIQFEIQGSYPSRANTSFAIYGVRA